jgi:hypothetical protein
MEVRYNILKDEQRLDITFATARISEAINQLETLSMNLDKEQRELITASLLQIKIMTDIIDNVIASFPINKTSEEIQKHFQDKVKFILDGVNKVVEGLKKNEH